MRLLVLWLATQVAGDLLLSGFIEGQKAISLQRSGLISQIQWPVYLNINLKGKNNENEIDSFVFYINGRNCLRRRF